MKEVKESLFITVLGRTISYKTFMFSGGEIHFRLDDPKLIKTADEVCISANLTSSDAIMLLMLAVDAFRAMNSSIRIRLIIPYFPYARQDRACCTGEAFSLRVMAKMINSLGVDTVEVWDPHSNVLGALLDNLVEIEQVSILNEHKLTLFDRMNINKTLLISPDAGAEKKVISAAKALGIEYITASKVRDPRTGDIVETVINTADTYLYPKNVLILDDICDGGRTFIELSKKLTAKGAEYIYLYVTHGIFSKGLGVLDPYFDQIFVANLVNFTDTDHPLIEVLK